MQYLLVNVMIQLIMFTKFWLMSETHGLPSGAEVAERRGARRVMLHMQMPASIDTSDRALVDSDHCLLAEYDQPLYQLS